MSTVEQKIRFCTENIRDQVGRPFVLPDSRRWVVEDLWRPVNGFKWWLRDDVVYDDLDEEAQALVGTITDWTFEEVEGLELHPVILTMVKVPRQEGETFNTMADCLATIFMDANETITYVAAAGDQAEGLFYDNVTAVVELNDDLKRSCSITNEEIYIPRTNSRLQIVPTSHKSITGRGRTRLIFDESRDIPARVFMAAQPAIYPRPRRAR